MIIIPLLSYLEKIFFCFVLIFMSGHAETVS